MLKWKFEAEESFVQQVLPDPCVQIVVEPDGAHVLGVVTGAFSAALQGGGFVFGLKFRPGGFYPFLRQPVARLTNRRLPLTSVFPDVVERRLKDLAAAANGQAVMDILESLLRKAAPQPDLRLQQVSLITDRIAADSMMLTVEHVADAFAISPRTLQRLFSTYVGVSPKWMIRRCRIQEAAARVETGGVQDWAELALRLGYFDQAHFINEFRTLVGRPPAEYAQSIGN